MIDTHCHLTAPQFDADREAVIERGMDAGILKMICVADAIEDIEPCRRLSERHSQIFFTAGAHPHHAKNFSGKEDLDRVREAAKNPKCRAIGEIGLDYHFDKLRASHYMHGPKEAQKKVFELQLELARELHLPAIVHCRSAPHQSLGSGTGQAIDDVWAIVSRVRPEKLVLHCCSERWEDVERFVRKGYLLSFTGIVTYPKSSVMRETVRNCPIEQLMLETDAPFLPPEALRAKDGRSTRNEPAFVIEVAKAVAAIKGLTVKEVDAKTTENAVEFFSLPS
ncbi:MAG: TatD family hydrolase [Candidatus Peribacteraceae bacterium]